MRVHIGLPQDANTQACIENLSLMSNTSNKYPYESLIMNPLRDMEKRLVNNRSNKLARLFAPRSIAFVGGTIAAMAIRRSVEMGYQGEICPVHPTRKSIEGFEVAAGSSRNREGTRRS